MLCKYEETNGRILTFPMRLAAAHSDRIVASRHRGAKKMARS